MVSLSPERYETELRATDDGGTWHVTLTPDGVEWRPGSFPADETVDAPARELPLLLNRRTEPVKPGPLLARWHAATRF